MQRNFYVRTCVKFTFANKIEAIHKRSLVGVKVEVDVFRLVARIFFTGGCDSSRRRCKRSWRRTKGKNWDLGDCITNMDIS